MHRARQRPSLWLVIELKLNGNQVGVRGADVVVLGVEKKSILQLQDPRTVRKVVMLDDHICFAFAGTRVSTRNRSPDVVDYC